MAALPLLLLEHVFVKSESIQITVFTSIAALVIISLLIPAYHVGFLWLVKALIEKHDGTIKTFFSGIKHFGIHSIFLFYMFTFATACVLSSLWFYGVVLEHNYPVVKYGLNAFSLWFLLFIIAIASFSWTALINKKAGITGAIRMAIALVLDNPVFTVLLLIIMSLLMLFCIIPPVFVCFSFAPVAVLQGSAYELLARKYSYLRSIGSTPENKKQALTIDFDDENDEYLCRGFRDLLFPWKE